MGVYNNTVKGATEHTKRHNLEVAAKLGIDVNNAVNRELELAASHYIKKYDTGSFTSLTGEKIYDVADYEYGTKSEVPDSVNPSLWIETRASREFGVFSVVGHDVVQTRGFDLANVEFIRGNTGWIIIDAASTVESAAYILKVTEEALGENIRDNIRAILISHSHMDHFGGIAGIINEERVGKEEGKVRIYAPRGFDLATRDEYVYAGNAMRRRCEYQMGNRLSAGVDSKVSAGAAISYVNGTASYIEPTDFVEEDCTLVIDGIHIDFILSDDTEAVANMLNYIHEYKALWVADNCIGTMHNIYTIRGARIRDAKAWADSMYQAYLKYGEKAEVIFQGHAWPHWKTEEEPDAVKEVLLNHAAAYQFTHDQALLYLNEGDTAEEISNKIELPDKVGKAWYLRPYYGDVRMNGRAIYNKYIGFYDGNPINLMPLSNVENAKKFVEYVGSPEAVLAKAKKDYDEGNYQYAAQAANAVVFADPDNKDARYLCADALEQLGYQSESGIFRNAYLTGAMELRTEVGDFFGRGEHAVKVLAGMEDDILLDYLGMTVDGNSIEELDEKLILTVNGVNASNSFVLRIYGGTILKTGYDKKEENVLSDYTRVDVSRKDLIRLIAGDKGASDAFEGDINGVWKKIADSIVNMYEYRNFPIIEP